MPSTGLPQRMRSADLVIDFWVVAPTSIFSGCIRVPRVQCILFDYSVVARLLQCPLGVQYVTLTGT